MWEETLREGDASDKRLDAEMMSGRVDGIYDVVMEALTMGKILGEASSSFWCKIAARGSAVNVCASELLRTIDDGATGLGFIVRQETDSAVGR
jgi:hypothetical protein